MNLNKVHNRPEGKAATFLTGFLILSYGKAQV